MAIPLGVYLGVAAAGGALSVASNMSSANSAKASSRKHSTPNTNKPKH